ncbi:MAG: hypothetical protein OXN90_01975 [Gemmatimonadota bacterium]|nr:hypothetical protein [Gemmatimonadota bacterium]
MMHELAEVKLYVDIANGNILQLLLTDRDGHGLAMPYRLDLPKENEGSMEHLEKEQWAKFLADQIIKYMRYPHMLDGRYDSIVRSDKYGFTLILNGEERSILLNPSLTDEDIAASAREKIKSIFKEVLSLPDSIKNRDPSLLEDACNKTKEFRGVFKPLGR